MKKVNCTVIYKYTNKHYELVNITVKHKHENILLYSKQWDETDRKHAFKYPLFNDLYRDVLAFLKSNNFYVHTWEMFGGKWFDIDFIDIDDFSINRYALH